MNDQAVQTVTVTAKCPECDGEVVLKEVMQNEIVQCKECGVDLEVTGINPVVLELAPEEAEDWGE